MKGDLMAVGRHWIANNMAEHELLPTMAINVALLALGLYVGVLGNTYKEK